MAIEETRTPYEFLARWDPLTGQFRGAHIQFYDAVMRDGVAIAGAPSKAYGVSSDQGAAFPLSDIMSQITIDALSANEILTAQLAVATTALQQAEQDRDAAIAERDAAIGQRDAAIAERDALKAHYEPTSENGVPVFVSRFQARAALHLAGLLDLVEQVIASPETPVIDKLAWQDSRDFHRNSPTLVRLAGALGLTDMQLDELFIQASQIKA